MSIFNEWLPKLNEISNAYTTNLKDELKAILDGFDKFEEELQNGRNRAREKNPKDKTLMTTLQSITEDEDGTNKTPENDKPRRRSSNKAVVKKEGPKKAQESDKSSTDSNPDKQMPVPKKRSKDEVDGMSSPEQMDKRCKRSASVKAQSIISKQVNMNLMQKLRREDAPDKNKSRRRNEDDKENFEPSVIQIKQEKESLLPEPMDMESLPLNIEVKQEANKDNIAMPPPALPLPKSRKAPAKDIQKDKSDDSDEETTSRRQTRNKKQTEPQPIVAGTRATRASTRASSRRQQDETQPVLEARPKRTRGRKKASDTTASSETINSETSQQIIENGIASPAEKPRPKRTRKAQKAAEKAVEIQEQQQKLPEIKQERLTEPEITSPICQKTNPKHNATKSKLQQNCDEKDSQGNVHGNSNPIANVTKTILVDTTVQSALDETRVISKDNMDKTVVLPNAVFNNDTEHNNNKNMNETVVIEAQDKETTLAEKQKVLDATVVLEKDPKAGDITDDNSILTDDNDDPQTPPKNNIPTPQPTSAVKEKVQQFEELASRVTRTKTRAMAKKAEESDAENQTPPDKISKAILDVNTLTKMNNLIFNGKTTQLSSSACKPRSQIPIKPNLPSSTSKLSSISRHKEEESLMKKEDDARMKKEAMLQAKRDQQKRKREEKMAAAAAARLAAERDRLLAAAAAEKERSERMMQLDAAKMERRRDLERKKQELARKVAETEERRRLEEQQRIQRLAEEQRRAEDNRRKQMIEQEIMKKEAAIMAKEIEMKQKQYIEKQKMKRKEESKSHTPLKSYTPSMLPPMEPAYMQDGFQHLNSDEDEEGPEIPPPSWATSKVRKHQLSLQAHIPTLHIDRLFSVRVHSPDLREIFPAIERSRLKRTSSAVWHTPTRLNTLVE